MVLTLTQELTFTQVKLCFPALFLASQAVQINPAVQHETQPDRGETSAQHETQPDRGETSAQHA